MTLYMALAAGVVHNCFRHLSYPFVEAMAAGGSSSAVFEASSSAGGTLSVDEQLREVQARMAESQLRDRSPPSSAIAVDGYVESSTGSASDDFQKVETPVEKSLRKVVKGSTRFLKKELSRSIDEVVGPSLESAEKKLRSSTDTFNSSLRKASKSLYDVVGTPLRQLAEHSAAHGVKHTSVEKRLMYVDIKVDESIRQVKHAIEVFNVLKSPVDWFGNIVQRELSLFEQAERRRLRCHSYTGLHFFSTLHRHSNGEGQTERVNCFTLSVWPSPFEWRYKGLKHETLWKIWQAVH